MVIDSSINALANLVLLVAIPFGFYYFYHRRKHGRGFLEVARRVGLRIGEVRYLWISFGAGLLMVGALLIWPPSVEA